MLILFKNKIIFLFKSLYFRLLISISAVDILAICSVVYMKLYGINKLKVLRTTYDKKYISNPRNRVSSF